MRLADRHHVGGIEHAAHLQLMFDRPLAGPAHLASQHRLFLIIKFHHAFLSCTTKSRGPCQALTTGDQGSESKDFLTDSACPG